MRARAGWVMVGTAAVAGAVAVAVSALDVGVESLGAHVAIMGAAAAIAAFVAYLLFGRFLRAGRLDYLLLGTALALLGASDLGFSAIPTAAARHVTTFSAWAAATVDAAAAVCVALAALAGARQIAGRRRAAAVAVASTALALAVVGVAIAGLDHDLPVAIDSAVSPNGVQHARFAGDPTLRAITLVAALLYAAGALAFARRSARERDDLYAWVAVAAALAGLAGGAFFVYPSRYSDWLFVGDYLMVGMYVALLLGAGREIAGYQRGLAAAAVLEERRRLARELHDGLAQELAFISTQSRRVLARKEAPDADLEQLAHAAERALDESRGAIAALTRRLDEPLEVAVAQAAEDVAGRVGVGVRLDLEAGIEVPARTREALLRIVREAVSNTARHGAATCVTVTLSGTSGVRLAVSDDGVGFDHERTAAGEGAGFGLMSMRERAEALGGELRVESKPGRGTRIEVVMP